MPSSQPAPRTGWLPLWLRPERTVPVTRWRSERNWTARPSTVVILIAGLAVFGAGDAFLVASHLGNSPWTVFAQGFSERVGISIGLATFIVSVAVLLLWIPLRQRPGMGTVANIVVIATALQVVVDLLPTPEHVLLRVTYVLVGIALVGIGSGFYLTCNVGPGPRDGWMTGVHRRTGWPVARIRLAIEVTVLLIGLLLGGTAGVGTIAFALLIGPSVAYGLKLAGFVGGTGSPDVTDDEAPELEA